MLRYASHSGKTSEMGHFLFFYGEAVKE